MAELPASCACSKEASRRRQETQGIPMILHCAHCGRRLVGPRFVWDVPGSSPAIPSKSLIFLRVFAVSWIVVRFPEVDSCEIGAISRKGFFHCFCAFPGCDRGLFFERFIVDAPET